MTRFRRRACIVLLLLVLFVCSLMMGLKTLMPNTAAFGNPFGLGLLPEFHQRNAVLESKRDPQSSAGDEGAITQKNFHNIIRSGSKATMATQVKLEDLPPPNYDFHVFYYTWYGNPRFDGKYIHWNHPLLQHWDAKIANSFPKGRHAPPDDIGSSFYPELGAYSSRDPSTIETHMKQMRSASIGVVALSWYPPGMADENGESTDDLVPIILDRAHKYKLKVAFHIEPYKGRDDISMYNHVKYIIDKYGSHPAFYRYKTSTGKTLPMFYVYDSYITAPEMWANLLTTSGSQNIRNTPYDGIFIGLLVEEKHKHEIHRSGFDGIYTYFATNGFSYGSSHHNWSGLKDFCNSNNLLFIPSVGPGYVDTSIRPWNSQNTRNRVNGKYYETALSAALHVRPDIISITSFNEWHEGTQIETAVPKRGKVVYQDYLPHKPDLYLELTRKWAKKHSEEKKLWLM
ncbi:glycoprotein endo-alpha-1,2-mannosidase [Microcaecilia unicolor]|uniref:Glycoprotein endo-alpha-1,2-mannosidase n=1 Tax=Microcaecilia unicolor TaxID=1415580 RepID=A0A6P7XL33_9AMPH|nr:glycoprotein endo-alpha-1,2-mannosidase [Microcaecilia unicolor]XP_030053901.1 glycoprotein endo-alpha-1,2-mannosidase [Microcaecilia unicolor]XP_030053902.1 glycoprotein endo-alpha-1,2-mannosidase [Microcaecilia unicolor]XP_030053903.1 glycoprotein endo-alpha-1,2-mannosidase [Microcaecilia unicolor]XP_030053904.1 glycoprotein endo-alpha-1,2-mannosidase [Microcaecilia unicolor]XP_030053905.1 glycoprotein endo-alpha-1,2-mannosidase [Microcaecilia unicolor]